MAARSELYVDPSINADSGAGTSGDPYGDLEYAIEQTTFDTTNGHRVNIKSGSTETLAAQLNTALTDTATTVAWAPSVNPPLCFQGYTTTAGDGGVGVISGGGSVSIYDNSTRDFVSFVDLELTDVGANVIVRTDRNGLIANCNIHKSTGSNVAVQVGAFSNIINCHVHDVAYVGIKVSGAASHVFHCFLEDGPTQNMSLAGIWLDGSYSVAAHNIVRLASGSTANGLRLFFLDQCVAFNNSVFAVNGTEPGIAATGRFRHSIYANLVEGFSGVGGVGIDFGKDPHVVGGNASYNNTTDYVGPTEFATYDLGDDESLSASPFTDPTNNDFNPVNTGNVKEGALPSEFGGGV